MIAGNLEASTETNSELPIGCISLQEALLTSESDVIEGCDDQQLASRIYKSLVDMLSEGITPAPVEDAQKEEASKVIATILEKLLGLQEFDSFERAVELIDVLDFSSGETHLFLGKVYSKAGYDDMAAEELVKAYKSGCIDAQGFYILGKKAFSHGLYDEAKVFLDEALKGGVEDLSLYVLLGGTFLKLGEIENALEMLGMGIEKYPDEPQSGEVVRIVKSIREKLSDDSSYRVMPWYTNPRDYWTERGKIYMNQEIDLVGKGVFRDQALWLIEEIRELAPKRILEVGCGYGRLVKVMSQQLDFDRFVGVDFSSTQLERAKNYIDNDRVELMLVDAKDGLPFEDNAFDLVYTSGCLMHNFPDVVPQILKEISRVSARWVIHNEDVRDIDHIYPHDYEKLHKELGNNVLIGKKHDYAIEEQELWYYLVEVANA